MVGSYYSDQVALIKTIARSMPVSHELYVKIHPGDVDGKSNAFYRSVAAVPGVRLIGHHANSLQLVNGASLVFSLSGTIACESALLGKPVIVFARNFFNSLPTVVLCDTPTELPTLVRRLLVSAAPPDLRERQLEFLSTPHARCVAGEVNRTYGTSTSPLTPDDLSILQRVYLDLARCLTPAQRADEPALH